VQNLFLLPPRGGIANGPLNTPLMDDDVSVFAACVSSVLVPDDQSLVIGLGLLKERQPSDLASAVLMVGYSFIKAAVDNNARLKQWRHNIRGDDVPVFQLRLPFQGVGLYNSGTPGNLGNLL